MSTEQSKTDNRGRPSGSTKSSSRFAPRNWRVPTRLTLLIVAPTLVAVLLAGVRVVGSIDSVNGYQRIRSAAEYSVQLRELAQQLALERDIGVWGGSRQRKFNVDGARDVTRNEQRAVVDSLVGKVRADLSKVDSGYGTRAVQEAGQVANRIDSLAGIRDNGAPEDYTAIIANILRLHDELGQNSDDPLVVGDANALSALAHAKEETALQRAMLTRELLERNQAFVAFELKDFVASQARQQGYLGTFYTEAHPAESSLLVTLLGDKDVVDTELTKSWALTLGLENVSLSRYPGREKNVVRWFQHSTKTIEQMANVEHRVSAALLDRSRQLQSAEQRNALIAGALILALLLLVLATTVLIARSMVRPLRRLRSEALEIAGTRLPGIVRRMRESEDTGREPQIQPIGVGTDDEIGEVARAFDEVHMQAVRLAAEESRLRANVNAMFVNLSRRTQTLVERQISLIDGLERGEEDGGRLADLFKLDHLATRMRRNSENLLVLAGHEPARKRSQPARLVDVVRASLSEVEDYERVTVKVHRGIAVAGHAANDMVHLVAELVENAIAFSPRNTRVIVSSSPVEGGAVMLGVSDAGIGMPPEEMAEVNHRLAEPPTVDVSVSRRMGLFVVGRLALRHGIRVQLRRGDGAGVIAMVLFPAQLVSNADQPVAGRPAAPAPQATAAIPARQAFADPAPSGVSAGGFQPWGTPPQQESSGAFSPWGAPGSPGSNGLPARRTSPPRDNSGDLGGGAFAPFGTPPSRAAGEPPLGLPAFTQHSGPHPVVGTPPVGAPVPGFPAEPEAPAGPPTFGDRPRPAVPEPPAAFTERSGAFPVADASSVTGPLPVVGDSPLERGDEFLPIFASVESAWFRRPGANGAAAVPAAGERDAPRPDSSASPPSDSRPVSLPASGSGAREPQVEPAANPTAEDAWWSRADSGFQAAATVKDPSLGGVTAAGLPKRTPRANLVPGSVGAGPASAAPRPPVSADAVRNRLSSFQQGVRRGRADLAEGPVEGPGNEEEGS